MKPWKSPCFARSTTVSGYYAKKIGENRPIFLERFSPLPQPFTFPVRRVRTRFTPPPSNHSPPFTRSSNSLRPFRTRGSGNWRAVIQADCRAAAKTKTKTNSDRAAPLCSILCSPHATDLAYRQFTCSDKSQAPQKRLDRRGTMRVTTPFRKPILHQTPHPMPRSPLALSGSLTRRRSEVRANDKRTSGRMTGRL